MFFLVLGAKQKEKCLKKNNIVWWNKIKTIQKIETKTKYNFTVGWTVGSLVGQSVGAKVGTLQESQHTSFTRTPISISSSQFKKVRTFEHSYIILPGTDVVSSRCRRSQQKYEV